MLNTYLLTQGETGSVAIVSTNGQKGGNFHREQNIVDMRIDIAKFDNCTWDEKNIFPWNFTTISGWEQVKKNVKTISCPREYVSNWKKRKQPTGQVFTTAAFLPQPSFLEEVVQSENQRRDESEEQDYSLCGKS